MPSQMHLIVGELAWRSLSEADQQAWSLSPEIPECAPDFMRRLETHSVAEKMAHYSVFLDYMGYRPEDFRKTPEYMLPGLVPVPHGAVAGDLMSAAGAEQLFDVWGWRYVLRTFVPRMFDLAADGKMEQAALFSGLLGHFLQDGASIGHLIPARLLYDLSPDDPATGHADLHAPFDNVLPELEPVTPQLLGTSVPEVVFRLSQMGEANYQEVLRTTIPMLEACRRGDTETMTAMSAPCYRSALLQLASLLHTVVALTQGTLDPEEVAATQDLDLTEAVGSLIHPGSDYRVVIPRNYTIDQGRYVPLRADLGNGPETVNPGLGMTSFHSIRYLMEPGAFSHVEGAVALSSDYLRDQEEQMEVEFFVGLDPDWNQIVDSDLQYGPGLTKAFSCRLKPGRPAQAFSVELGDAQTLMFGVRPEPLFFAGGGYRCWYPHVVLVAPKLVKT